MTPRIDVAKLSGIDSLPASLNSCPKMIGIATGPDMASKVDVKSAKTTHDRMISATSSPWAWKVLAKRGKTNTVIIESTGIEAALQVTAVAYTPSDSLPFHAPMKIWSSRKFKKYGKVANIVGNPYARRFRLVTMCSAMGFDCLDQVIHEIPSRDNSQTIGARMITIVALAPTRIAITTASTEESSKNLKRFHILNLFTDLSEWMRTPSTGSRTTVMEEAIPAKRISSDDSFLDK
jgi:hypothetical protein